MKALLLVFLLCFTLATQVFAGPPNVVIIFADDLGYGDLGVYGNPTIHTPHLDRLATDGQKWTNFYVAASVCTPSRAGLMTGRLPIRSGMTSTIQRVLFPDSTGGLPPDEITIAEVLKGLGYTTAALGKWHLGHRPQFLPTAQGFDSYFGIPYSNDMDLLPEAPKGWSLWADPDFHNFHVPLMRDEEIIERPADQNTITRRYTEEAVRFIRAHREGPFFLYLAHNLPHVPLFRSHQFADSSLRGLYGDVVEEIDWSVGQIRQTLEAEGIADNTLVIFTSDNGPWLTYFEQGGSAGPLREGKGSTWEGGMREPAIFWWPGHITPHVVHDMGSTLDLLPTVAALAGGGAPGDRVLDGHDLSGVLLGTARSPRNEMFFYRGPEIFAARVGNYKVHYKTQPGFRNEPATPHDPPLLYDLAHDPGEHWDIAEDHPEIVKMIAEAVARHKATVVPVKDQLIERDRSVLSDQTTIE